jgi:DAK2 domain fusion protein YloV
VAQLTSTSSGVGWQYDGRQLAAAYRAGAHWLARHAARVDALNVFPVPDGDTGTNMRLTMDAAVMALERQPRSNAGEAAGIAAQAALLGARGNSGVILSQILAGVAAALHNRTTIDAAVVAVAAREAARFAYKAVTAPVEGTMLTVTKEVAAAIEEAVQRNAAAGATLEAAVQSAHRVVARTPDMLPRLRQAGVVDAGAEGLAVILDGVLRFVRGESLEVTVSPAIVRPNAAALTESAHTLDANGYCTNFLVRGVSGDTESARAAILALGSSVVVAVAGDLLKVHVHTEHPGLALEVGARLGELTAIEITNMRDQVAAVQALSATEVGERPGAPDLAAVISVVATPELAAVFAGFGAGAVLGGQTMNPSVGELRAAIEATGARHVFVLPNNANILLTAQEAARLSERPVSVIPSTSVPQGVAAAIAFLTDRTDAENAQAMATAASTVTTVEVTLAARDTTAHGCAVTAGQPIAVVDDVITTTASTVEAAALAAAVLAFCPQHTLLTIYVGVGIAPQQVDWLEQQFRTQLPAVQLEVVTGRQPHYPFILALE